MGSHFVDAPCSCAAVVVSYSFHPVESSLSDIDFVITFGRWEFQEFSLK